MSQFSPATATAVSSSSSSSSLDTTTMNPNTSTSSAASAPNNNNRHLSLMSFSTATSTPQQQMPSTSTTTGTTTTATATHHHHHHHDPTLRHPLDTPSLRIPTIQNIISSCHSDIISLQNTSCHVLKSCIMVPLCGGVGGVYDCWNGCCCGVSEATGDGPIASSSSSSSTTKSSSSSHNCSSSLDNCILWNREKFQRVSSGCFWLSEDPMERNSKSWDSTTSRSVVWCRLRRIARQQQHDSASSPASSPSQQQLHDSDSHTSTDEETTPTKTTDSSHLNSSSTSHDPYQNKSLDDFYVLSTHLDLSDHARRYSMFLIREFVEQFLLEEEELDMEQLGSIPLFIMGNFNALRDSPTMNILLTGMAHRFNPSAAVNAPGGTIVTDDDQSDGSSDDSDDDCITLHDLRPEDDYSVHHTYTGFEYQGEEKQSGDTNEEWKKLINTQWPAIPSQLSRKAVFPQNFSSPRLGRCSCDYIISSVPFNVRNFKVWDEMVVERTQRYPSDHRPISCEVYY